MRLFTIIPILFLSCAAKPSVPAPKDTESAVAATVEQASVPSSEPTLVAEGTFIQLAINGGVHVMYADADGYLNYLGPYQPAGYRYQLRFKGVPKPGDSFRITAEVDGSHLFTVLK